MSGAITPCFKCIYCGTRGMPAQRVCRKRAPGAAMGSASAHQADPAIALWPPVYQDDGCSEGRAE